MSREDLENIQEGFVRYIFVIDTRWSLFLLELLEFDRIHWMVKRRHVHSGVTARGSRFRSMSLSVSIVRGVPSTRRYGEFLWIMRSVLHERPYSTVSHHVSLAAVYDIGGFGGVREAASRVLENMR